MTHSPSSDPRLGNPNFRFREKEIARILAQWESGDSVLLTGIRRTGKSELMKAALYRYQNAGHTVAYLDLQGEEKLPRFYQNLLQAILANLPLTLRGQFGKVLEGALKVPNDLMHWIREQTNEVKALGVVDIKLNSPEEQVVRYWQPITEQIAKLIKPLERAEVPVIGLDELPFMLENLIRAGVNASELIVMLATLRTLRDAGLRMIIGGSISFENLLTIHKIPHTPLGGLFRLQVAPFTRFEAELFLQEILANRFCGTAVGIAKTLDTLPDYIPEVLRIAKGFLFTCEDLDACEYSLINEVMPAVRRSFVQQFDERLSKNYTATELACAEQILDSIAQGSATGTRLNGQQLPAGYQRVINLLQYDNFIIDSPDFGWCFSLNLIRLWWRASRGMV
jgi:hypothetical protein